MLRYSEDVRRADEVEKDILKRECVSLGAQLLEMRRDRENLAQENELFVHREQERETRDEEAEQDLQHSVEALRVSKVWSAGSCMRS